MSDFADNFHFVIWWYWFNSWCCFRPQKPVVTPWGYLTPKNVKNPMTDIFVDGFCWKFTYWVIWWCLIHFWCCFDPKKLFWFCHCRETTALCACFILTDSRITDLELQVLILICFYSGYCFALVNANNCWLELSKQCQSGNLLIVQKSTDAYQTWSCLPFFVLSPIGFW